MMCLRIPSCSIESVAGVVPAKCVDNLSFCAAHVGPEKAQAILAATGFPTRREAPQEALLPMCLKAAELALGDFARADIGGVIVVSFSSHECFPAVACRLQKELNLPCDIPCFDVNMACSGYTYGLYLAAQLATATHKRILLVDGDIQSAFLGTADVNTASVMGDGVTATIISPEGGEASFAFRTNGAGGEVLQCPREGPIRMDGFGVFKFVAGEVRLFLADFLKACEKPAWFVPHQANLYMVRQLAVALGLQDRLILTEGKYANTGSSSVPLLLAERTNLEGRLLVAGFGAGLSAGAAAINLKAHAARGVSEWL